MARPARVLVRALAIALIAGIAGVVFSKLTAAVPMSEIRALNPWLFFDGFAAAVLVAAEIARAMFKNLPEGEA